MKCKICGAEAETLPEMRQHYIDSHPDRLKHKKNLFPLAQTAQATIPATKPIIKEELTDQVDKEYSRIIEKDIKLALKEMLLARLERRTKELKGEVEPMPINPSQLNPVELIRAVTDMSDKAQDKALAIQDMVNQRLEAADVPAEQKDNIGGIIDFFLGSPEGQKIAGDLIGSFINPGDKK